MSWFRPSPYVFLTGAGFTHNYGGHLATQMWAAIFGQPEIRTHGKLRDGMLNFLNYEELYDLVLRGSEYSVDERHAFVAAVRRAYENMHSRICHQQDPNHTATAAAVCRAFLSRFAGTGQQRGFFFTLNHDLFVEQFFTTETHLLQLPGLQCPRWFNCHLGPGLSAETRVPLPNEGDVDALKERFWQKGTIGSFVYIKLHGSLGWIGGGGEDVMVIGQTKSEVIEREPLLRWYFSLFKEVLAGQDAWLVTVGYGFRDRHINDAIADAIKGHGLKGLKLCVVTPEDPGGFRSRLMGEVDDYGGPAHRGDELWNGLYYYCQARVTDLYDPSASRRLPPRGEQFFDDIGL